MLITWLIPALYLIRLFILSRINILSKPSAFHDENVMNYAIRSCSVQELNSGLAFTMYDFSNNQDCGNSAIHFSVTEDLEMGGWNISYLFFLFQNIEVVNYQLHCSVTLCSNSNSASKCNEIKQVCG